MRDAALADLVRQLAAAYVAGLRERGGEPEDGNGGVELEQPAASPNKHAETEGA